MTEQHPLGDQRAPVPPAPVPRLGPLAAGAFSLLMVGSVYALPLAGLVIAPLGLVPVLHRDALGTSRAPVWLLVVLLLAVCTAFQVTFALELLAMYLLLIAVPAGSVWLWRRFGWPEGRWAAITVIGSAAVILIITAVAVAPEKPVDGTRVAIREWAVQLQEVAPEASDSNGNLELALDTTEKHGSWIMPSLPVAYLVLVLFWIRPRLLMLGFRLPIAPFELYRSEEWLPAAFAVTGAATVLLHGSGRWVALNLLLAVLLLYFVHGLAIIRAHLVRFVGRGWLVRWGIALFCLVQPMPVLVALLGVTDSFFPLRPRLEDDGGSK